MQGNTRYLINDFLYQAHKLQLKHSRGAVRLYGVKENIGQLVPLDLLGMNLLGVVKQHTTWFRHFLVGYGGYLEALLTPSEQAAFQAHYGFPVPGGCSRCSAFSRFRYPLSE
jgi:hypothetical protein